MPLLCLFAVPLCVREFNTQKQLTLLTNAPKPEPATIVGTVVDINDDAIPGATVVLEGHTLRSPRTFVTKENGFFEFSGVGPETYQVKISVSNAFSYYDVRSCSGSPL
ncbi:MAG: carboxypeptidase-like regulatory domain-containing protein [Terriglobales bacterium]